MMRKSRVSMLKASLKHGRAHVTRISSAIVKLPCHRDQVKHQRDTAAKAEPSRKGTYRPVKYFIRLYTLYISLYIILYVTYMLYS